MSLLELNDITASYGPTQALFGVDLSLEAGEVCALMAVSYTHLTLPTKRIV